MIDKREAVRNEGGGGGKPNPNVQKKDDGRVLNTIAVVLVALIAVGVLVALLCK